MNELAVNLVWRARYVEMHACAERAIAAARRLGDPPLTAAALALAHDGGIDDGRGRARRGRVAREATALVDSLSDEDLARHLESATRLAGTEL